ncbi:gamma-glutamylcyclotransferase [Actinokineospora sp. PR83]|uniref:gamma-glutamylcyclotransferase family protein n=1 Tax=Actinokineospora sp. PR83 TaxID=2884908 RepID=UPI0027DF03CA|nr:gamma-glutamylcyclotransferase [Actinokineospora sp. PR83]MCG8917446.1 gamma-glutamylcyclotransferase [Actinokineospora sp. PR83]
MFVDAEFPAVPYPGARPPYSYAHDGGRGVRLTADPAALSGWRAGGVDLDEWLGARGGAPMAGRVPVLSYGSNPCPSKLTWLRDALGLVGPVVVLRARCTGLAAVWAAGLRVVDDQRPVVLAALGGVEDHAVLMLAPEQVAVLDVCEGRGHRYALARVRTGTVELLDSTDDGTSIDGVLAYVGAAVIRRPLLVSGAPVRCADVPQAEAVGLIGEPAAGDGLDVEVVSGPPAPEAFPGRLFVYGTLQPGAPMWPLLAGVACGEPRPGRLAGSLYDTGLGYPALRLGDGPGVSGWTVPLRAGVSLAALDEYEGPEYARVRVVVDGAWAWTYVWLEPVEGMSVLSAPWPVHGHTDG